MQEPPATNTMPASVPSRALQLLLVSVIAVAFVGLVVGIRQGTPVYEPPQRDPHPISTDPNAIAATAYADFDRRRIGPNSQWQSTLSDLEQPEVELFLPPHRTEAGRRAVLAARSQRRAFDGAPPVVPHPIDQMGTASCMACHGQGLSIGQVIAPAMSHTFMANCTQCHVEQQATDLAQLATAANTFIGLDAPFGGERAWPGAPPTIPHTTFMRDNCLSCHGINGPEPIRTTHPWQTNCLQCHAPSAVLDQAVFDSAPLFLE